jgi:hypothetical protein
VKLTALQLQEARTLITKRGHENDWIWTAATWLEHIATLEAELVTEKSLCSEMTEVADKAEARAEAAERTVANMRDDIQIVKESREHEATLAQRAIAERDALQAGVDAVMALKVSGDSVDSYRNGIAYAYRRVKEIMAAAIQASKERT